MASNLSQHLSKPNEAMRLKFVTQQVGHITLHKSLWLPCKAYYKNHQVLEAKSISTFSTNDTTKENENDFNNAEQKELTHWGRVMHICVTYLTIIASDNSLSPNRRQAIIWTNAGILLIRSLGTNCIEILIEIHIFIQENAFENVVWKMAAILSGPQCVKGSVVHDYKSAGQEVALLTSC